MVFPKVEIHLKTPTAASGRETYYRYELKNVMVTSYQVAGRLQKEILHIKSEIEKLPVGTTRRVG